MRICAKCRGDIAIGEFINALDETWHKNCFVCNSCSKPFVGGESCFMGDEGLPMHEKCFQNHERNRAKSCGICRGPLLSGEAIVETGGDGRQHHQKCFKCTKCNRNFDGTSYVVESSKPYHIDCSPTAVSNNVRENNVSEEEVCSGCSQEIIDSSRKIVPGLGHYHPQCFVCDTCHTSMGTEKKYYEHPHSGKPTCGRCIQEYQ